MLDVFAAALRGLVVDGYAQVPQWSHDGDGLLVDRMRLVAGKRFGIGEFAIDDHINLVRVLIELCIADDFQVINVRDLPQPPQRGDDGLDIFGIFRTEEDDMSYQGMTSGAGMRELALAAAA
jgi:hypothetical protein